MSMTYLCTKFKNMTELKSCVVMAVGAVVSLLAPIQNFMYAMMLLFGLNFCFGFLADRLNGREWDTKKAMKFLLYCCLFFVAACCIFIIGYLMGEMDQSVAVVKVLCWGAIYIFGTNIFRNWREILTPGTAWYRFVDLMYYILSVKFIERFDWVKSWKSDREKAMSNGRTILDKDDN